MFFISLSTKIMVIYLVLKLELKKVAVSNLPILPYLLHRILFCCSGENIEHLTSRACVCLEWIPTTFLRPISIPTLFFQPYSDLQGPTLKNRQYLQKGTKWHLLQKEGGLIKCPLFCVSRDSSEFALLLF